MAFYNQHKSIQKLLIVQQYLIKQLLIFKWFY